jgi:hypothetical protein
VLGRFLTKNNKNMITALKTLSILVISFVQILVAINQHIATDIFLLINKKGVIKQSKEIILSVENQQLVSIETCKNKITTNFKNQNFIPCLLYLFLSTFGICVLLFNENKTTFKLKTDFINSKKHNNKKLKLNSKKVRI